VRWRLPLGHIAKWLAAALLALFLAAALWACWTAPPWGAMQPPRKPSFLYLSSDGTPLARRGTFNAPVDAAALPTRVKGAFIAIEDRRFNAHHGVDLRGMVRAFWHNFRASGVVEGGSTITQQLVKSDFLTSDRKVGRKVQEIILAVWLDSWLSKDEILSRYLSTIYFGDGAYGLRAAAEHYFRKTPEKLSVAEAAMLAGMVKAPSRLNPVGNLSGARARSRLVLDAMAEEGMISSSEAASARSAVPRVSNDELASGTYFVDWVASAAEARFAGSDQQFTVTTTLDRNLQKAAVRALTAILSRQGRAAHATQAALVAMRPDGRVVAMIGGRSYAASPFNRATQARRQPGSAYKLAVYLAALEHGYTTRATGEKMGASNCIKLLGGLTIRSLASLKPNGDYVIKWSVGNGFAAM
jgi:penicillin-binding protein 1A